MPWPADCADCATKEGKIDSIERDITLDGALTEDQQGRLLQLADRCPIHQTLIFGNQYPDVAMPHYHCSHLLA